MTIITRARDLAENTPDSRNRYVDALRALSILVVVFGHWLIAGPEMRDGALRAGHLIAEARWAQWATWIFQVMPIFFFVGGYANAAGWRSARRDRIPYGTWLRERLRRLVLPVLPVLAVWTVVASAAISAGLDRDLLRIGSQAALVPVWFLATYVVIVAMTPITLELWERRGWIAFAVLAGGAALIDVANLAMGVTWAQWSNYLLVWNAVHVLGYAWADSRIGDTRTRLSIAMGGFTLLAALVALFPYPLAMVGFDGTGVTNSNPPKVTLVALGLFQFGVAMALEPAMRRVLARLRIWTAVITVSGSIMTLYLWHLTAMVAVVGIAMSMEGFGLEHSVNSAGWWVTRPAWLMVLIVATLPFLAVFGRFERPRRDARPAPAAWRPLLAVVGTGLGLGLLAKNGIADAEGLNGLALALPFAAVAVGGLTTVGRPRRPRRS